MMMRLLHFVDSLVEQIPSPIQIGGNITAVTATYASLCELIHGSLEVVAVVLSIIWFGLQIFSWWEKRKKDRGK